MYLDQIKTRLLVFMISRSLIREVGVCTRAFITGKREWRRYQLPMSHYEAKLLVVEAGSIAISDTNLENQCPVTESRGEEKLGN